MLVDPRLTVNSQVKSIFTNLKRKGMFDSTKGNSGLYFKRINAIENADQQKGFNEYLKKIIGMIVKIFLMKY